MEHPYLWWGNSGISNTRADFSADARRSLQRQQYANVHTTKFIQILFFFLPEEKQFNWPGFFVKKLNVKTHSCPSDHLFCTQFQYLNAMIFSVSSSKCPSFREEMLTHSLRKLREQIVKANLYVREANFIGEELDKRTEYKVTLQIPASSLNANSKVR